MSFKETVSRVYREHAATYNGQVSRSELFESAAASIMVEVAAGRVKVDTEAAIRAALIQADEADGRSADRIIARAALGDVPLLAPDLDVVVTLGGGMRKTFWQVVDADIDLMIEVRYRNYTKVRDAFREFRLNAEAVRGVVREHGTFGAAFEAGGFPPKHAHVGLTAVAS